MRPSLTDLADQQIRAMTRFDANVLGLFELPATLPSRQLQLLAGPENGWGAGNLTGTPESGPSAWAAGTAWLGAAAAAQLLA